MHKVKKQTSTLWVPIYKWIDLKMKHIFSHLPQSFSLFLFYLFFDLSWLHGGRQWPAGTSLSVNKANWGSCVRGRGWTETCWETPWALTVLRAVGFVPVPWMVSLSTTPHCSSLLGTGGSETAGVCLWQKRRTGGSASVGHSAGTV